MPTSTQSAPTPDRDDSSHVQLVERDGVAQLFAFAKLPHVSASAPQRWVHVAREGVWRGHQSGVEIALTHDVLAGFVTRFAAQKNATPGTYGHPQGDDFPASLWILDMELRGTDLWALCEFTPAAVKAIEGAEFRYCSIKFALESIDRVTGQPAGPVIQQLGLTNIPFIDGLTPIALSTLSLVGATAPAVTPRSYTMAAMIDPQTMLDNAYKAVGKKPKDASPEQVLAMLQAAIDYLKTQSDKAAPAAPAPDATGDAPALSAIALADAPVMPGADEPLPVEGAEAAATAIVSKLMEATGLDATALLGAVEQNLDALVAVLTAAPTGTGLSASTAALSLVQRSNAALGARVVALSAEVQALTAGNAAREAKLRDDVIAAEFVRLRDVTGHVIEDMRADFTTFALSAGIDAATKIFGRGPAPGGAPLTTGAAAPVASATGDAAAPIDDTDPAVRIHRMSAKGLGYKGAEADDFVRRAIEMSART